MKIVCDKREFAALIRGCWRQMHTTGSGGCSGCFLRGFCSDEPEEAVESICEIREEE